MIPMVLLLRLPLLLGIFSALLPVETSFSATTIHNVVEAYPVVVRPAWISTSYRTAAVAPVIFQRSSSLSSMVPSDVEDDMETPTATGYQNERTTHQDSEHPPTAIPLLKRQLIELCASYDRGFGASTLARQTIDRTVQEIQKYNDDSDESNSIIGYWRMIYTTALDVLSLQTSPVFTAGAIYQAYSNNDDKSNSITTNKTTSSTTAVTTVTNIIDFIPRFQSVVPLFLFSTPPNTLIRATVQTRRVCQKSPAPNRIGLIFDSVSIQPIECLGWDASFLPPLAFNLPKLPNFGASSSASVATGYFDVSYLDEELLIIRQNAPGGIFCLLPYQYY